MNSILNSKSIKTHSRLDTILIIGLHCVIQSKFLLYFCSFLGLSSPIPCFISLIMCVLLAVFLVETNIEIAFS
ncbi:hypothetical protein QWZ13_15540 [Reinekea marina]|uniref:hypothetical protein n=1 Tax=Reinekea marina TaxID=1310421 RepID=UPI0025B48DDE|nr:hypothetical protein [Reinekea marina]MDN3650319.1 hypothetical protein [Reinekea marina]